MGEALGAAEIDVLTPHDHARDVVETGFTCRFIDSTSILYDGQPLAPKSKKFVALIALFHLSEAGELQRDRITALLWSESPEEKAKASLRNTLYLQKDFLDADCPRIFTSQRDRIVYSGRPGSSDLDRLLADIEARHTDGFRQVSFEKFADRLFLGLDSIDPAFDDWLAQNRQNTVSKIAEALLASLDETDPTEDQRVAANKLLEIQPENEVACRTLMRLDWAEGNVASALKRYDTLWRYLDEEFDVEPSEPTLDLVVALKTASAPPSGPMVQAHSNEIRTTIFVRGFSTTNVGDADFFVRGIHAELMSALFAVDDWVIVEPDDAALPASGTGFFELKGDVAPGLGQVRLILTLKDLSNGRIIWNETIPIESAGWAQHSALAVMRLAGLLISTVETSRYQQVEALSDADLSDYDRLMRARVLMYDWDMAKDREAETLFRSVADSGRLGMRAKVGLVELLNSRHLVFPGIDIPDGQQDEALSIARECRADAPTRPDVNLCLAWSSLLAGKYDETIEAAQRTADYSSSNPRRLASAAECMSLAGEIERGLSLAQTSESLDLGANRLSHGYRVSVHFAAQDAEACMTSAKLARGAIILGYGYAAAAAVEVGEEKRAADFWSDFCDAARQSWCGGDPPTDEQLASWLVKASPLAPHPTRDRFEKAVSRLSP